MSNMDKYRFHRAARDGYLDLLREATRKDCNTQDEDGMTPTLWAAYYGHLDALRLLVGRGGDPDKCDHYGNTALHCAAAKGHMNCLSFLVNFGVNLWALDNDFHTSSDIAAMNYREEILRYLDDIVARQSALNKKIVKKLKEKAVMDAEKRIKNYQRMQKRAVKKAEKEERDLEKQRKKMFGGELPMNGTKCAELQSLRRDSKLLYSSQKYSDLISTTGVGTTRKGLGAVSKKVQMKKQINIISTDFKVREVESDGRRSIRSLSGLRRDSEIMYVPKYDTQSTSSGSNRRHLKDLFDNRSELSRAISEPDFLHTTDSGLGDEIVSSEPSSIFERPGFGSVAFRNSMSGAMMSLPSGSECEDSGSSSRGNSNDEEEELTPPSDKGSNPRNGSVDDSIGSASSLAHRNRHLAPWDEDDLTNCEEDEIEEDDMPLILFLAANGLTDYTPVFSKEKIDLDAISLLSEEDLKVLGLPLGPRRKLLKAVERRKNALENPGEIADSRL